MAEAIRAANSLDRERRRGMAHRRFSLERMVGRYFALYHRLAGARLRP